MRGIRKFWLRFTMVFFFHLIVKSFDLSFSGGPFEWSFRSLVFTAFFLSYGLIIWWIADYLNTRFQNWVKKMKSEKKRLLFVFLLHVVFGYILVISLNQLYRIGDIYIFDNREIWSTIFWLNPELTISLLSMYLVVFGFDNYLQVQNRLQGELIKAKELEKENILAQYKALKAQIEPHFLFNSLSVLSSLVFEDAELSSDFILKMSKTLRYVIEKNEYHLVKLAEELEFLKSYFFLIKIRLDKGVFLENRLEETFIENTYIVPVTLQLLVENAVNHNKYDPSEPLTISIEKENNFIVVKNNLNPRINFIDSTQTGLKNLKKRYELMFQKEVTVEVTDSDFIVKIPVLKSLDYERFNF